MKILLLSDLHRTGVDHCQNRAIDVLMEKHKPDVVVISGDVYESGVQLNPFKDLSRRFYDTTVVFVLGNHEFFNNTPANTLKYYAAKYRPEKYDVHCLDTIGHYDMKNVRFLGNVLWYDGSMSTIPGQDLYDWSNGVWMDKCISGGKFKYKEECLKCREQIEDSIKSTPEGMIKIMVTHCVPHKNMNGHMSKIRSPFNAYSGVAGYLEELNEKGLYIDYSVSGHTHWRIIGKRICNVDCINVGSDYGEVEYYVLDI